MRQAKGLTGDDKIEFGRRLRSVQKKTLRLVRSTPRQRLLMKWKNDDERLLAYYGALGYYQFALRFLRVTADFGVMNDQPYREMVVTCARAYLELMKP